MKSLILLATSFIILQSCKEPSPKDIQQTVEAYVKAADEQNAEALSDLTHSEFRVVWNGPEPSDHTFFPREVYLEKFRIKEWGGDPREIEIHDCELFGNYAAVHVSLEGNYQDFESIFVLVRDKENWKLLQENVLVKPSS